jgi:hypothetical protein
MLDMHMENDKTRGVSFRWPAGYSGLWLGLRCISRQEAI